MRRTTTTQNRFTICIPNWPAKPLILALGWVLFLFSSCKDDAALVGFRKDAKLGTRYVEIPLVQSTILRSPISTRNFLDEDLARILVGRYNDPAFGNIEAKGYFTLSIPLQTTFIEPTAVFESLELHLKFDYYAYGATDSSDQRIQVFEIIDVLNPAAEFYNNTPINISGTAAGDITFAMGPVELQNAWERYVDQDLTNDSYYKLVIPLTGTSLGQNMLDDLVNNPLMFQNFDEFTARYPGLAVTMIQGNKILGITPVYSLPTPDVVDSKLILKYTYGTSSGSVEFPIYYGAVNGVGIPVVSFSTISSDRTSTPLEGIIPFEDLVPATNSMYVQSGTGILAKYDLGNFYQYVDSLDNVIINSAEMVFTNTSENRPPQRIELRVLDSTNQFRDIYSDPVKRINDQYLVKIQSGINVTGIGEDESAVSILTALTGATIPVDQETRKIGSTILTEFFQQIYNYKNDPRRVKAFAVCPLDYEIGKTTSSLILNQPSATLRIYYSKPLTSLP